MSPDKMHTLFRATVFTAPPWPIALTEIYESVFSARTWRQGEKPPTGLRNRGSKLWRSRNLHDRQVEDPCRFNNRSPELAPTCPAPASRSRGFFNSAHAYRAGVEQKRKRPTEAGRLHQSQL